MLLIYSPVGSNIYGGRDGNLRGRVGVEVESCKIMFLEGTSYSLVQTHSL